MSGLPNPETIKDVSDKEDHIIKTHLEDKHSLRAALSGIFDAARMKMSQKAEAYALSLIASIPAPQSESNVWRKAICQYVGEKGSGDIPSAIYTVREYADNPYADMICDIILFELKHKG